ncbi:MAG: DNA repair protein RecO [Phycisphaeraceae bacterium]
MAHIQDQAICIRHQEWSETSEIVVLMTEQHGKVRGLAKGAKRTSPSSVERFSGGIALLTRGEIVGVLRTSTELATLTEWDLQDDYPHLRRSLEAQRLALYVADVTHALMADQDPHPRTYAALRGFLEASAEPHRRPGALLRFQWELLDDAGFRPELRADVHSGEVLPEQASYGFDPTGGGLTLDPTRSAWQVRAETVQLLRELAESGQGAAPETAIQRANRLLCVYVRAILDQELPTMAAVLREDRP